MFFPPSTFVGLEREKRRGHEPTRPYERILWALVHYQQLITVFEHFFPPILRVCVLLSSIIDSFFLLAKETRNRNEGPRASPNFTNTLSIS